jgi:anti-sigma-K factor RskA
MPPATADDHTEEFEQLAGLAAVGVLDGDDRVRFEEHAARCERCRVMVQLDLEALARAAPEMDPSPDFKARLMERAAAELAQQREPIQLRPAPPPNVVPVWRRSPWASAIAALLVVSLVVVGAYSFQNQVVASYALSGNLGGSAVVNVRRSGATELDMSGVQNPPPGFVYEAWIIPPNGQPIAAGTTQSGDATLPLSQLTNGTTVAVTQEQGQVSAPTSQPIMAVVVQV